MTTRQERVRPTPPADDLEQAHRRRARRRHTPPGDHHCPACRVPAPGATTRELDA